jgi:hypothetical protein
MKETAVQKAKQLGEYFNFKRDPKGSTIRTTLAGVALLGGIGAAVHFSGKGPFVGSEQSISEPVPAGAPAPERPTETPTLVPTLVLVPTETPTKPSTQARIATPTPTKTPEPTATPTLTPEPTATPDPTPEATSTPVPPATSTPEATSTPVALQESLASGENEPSPIPVPEKLSDVKIVNLGPNFPESKWSIPIYDPDTANAENNWVGIGPHYPVAFENIDPNASTLESNGNVGELVITANQGGNVLFAVMQPAEIQDQGKWATDSFGNSVNNPDWFMQYEFHGLEPGQVLKVIDPDTGEQLTWDDGSPVEYTANPDNKVASVWLPFGEIRVAFQTAIKQFQSLTVKRGPDDQHHLGETNPLPPEVVRSN